MTLDSFYKMLKVACASHPSINTFAVVDDVNDISLENLKKNITTISKPYFWSRIWTDKNTDPSNIKFDNPTLFLLQKSSTLTYLFQSTDSINHNFDMLFVINDHSYQLEDKVPDSEQLENTEAYIYCTKVIREILLFINTYYKSFKIYNEAIKLTPFRNPSVKIIGIIADITFKERCIVDDKFWLENGLIVDGDGTPIDIGDGSGGGILY